MTVPYRFSECTAVALQYESCVSRDCIHKPQPKNEGVVPIMCIGGKCGGILWAEQVVSLP